METLQSYSPQKLFNRYFILIWVEAFTLQMGQNIFNSLISVYAISRGFSNTFAGSLSIPYMILAIFGRFFSGYISDHRSRKLGMFIGCTAFAVGSIFYSVPVFAVPAIMMAARGIHGFGYAAASTAYSAAVVDVTPKKKLSIGLGINWTAQGISQLVSGVVMVVLVFGTNYQPIFILSVVCCVIAAISALLCNYEIPCAPSAQTTANSRLRLSDILEVRALPNAFVTLLYYTGIGIATVYTIALANSRGVENGGFFFTAVAFGMVFANVFLVRIAERIGRLKTLVPLFLIGVLCNVTLAMMQSAAALLVAGIMYGVALGAMSLIQSETVENLPVNRRGAGTSTLFLAMDLGMGIGPLIWGVVIDATCYTAAYYAAAVVVALACVSLVIVFSRKR